MVNGTAQLFTQSEIDIVRFLLRHFREKFTKLDLAEQLGKGKSYKNVRESIQKLVDRDFISIERVGASNLCSLNLQNNDTVNLITFIEHFDKEFGLFHKIKEIGGRLVNQLKEHTPFFILILFGSYAKNTAHEKSDVDFIIIADKEHHAGVKKEIEHIQAIYTLTLNAFVLTRKDYEEMLRRKDTNIGRESLANHVVLYGAEQYYHIVRDVLGEG